MKALVLTLVQLLSAGGHRIDVNPDEITVITDPREDLFAEGVLCVIGLTNGKFISLGEDCASVRRKLGGKG